MISPIFAAILAATTVYRLELTDEVPYIVGEDGVRREVCLVSPADFAMMTGRVDAVWQALNATHDGRVSLHGRLVRQEVTNGVKYDIYADGYRYGVPMTKKAVQATAPAVNTDSARRRAYLKAKAARKPRTITIERDAATGKEVAK